MPKKKRLDIRHRAVWHGCLHETKAEAELISFSNLADSGHDPLLLPCTSTHKLGQGVLIHQSHMTFLKEEEGSVDSLPNPISQDFVRYEKS